MKIGTTVGSSRCSVAPTFHYLRGSVCVRDMGMFASDNHAACQTVEPFRDAHYKPARKSPVSAPPDPPCTSAEVAALGPIEPHARPCPSLDLSEAAFSPESNCTNIFCSDPPVQCVRPVPVHHTADRFSCASSESGSVTSSSASSYSTMPSSLGLSSPDCSKVASLISAPWKKSVRTSFNKSQAFTYNHKLHLHHTPSTNTAAEQK